jgi:hypothetical protein
MNYFKLTGINIFVTLCLWLPYEAMAERYAAVICGSGGTVEFIEKFNDWGNRLHTTLIHDLSFPEDNVHLFSADVADATTIQAEPCNLAVLKFYFASLKPVMTAEDDLYLFFIGHGSYTANEIMFHLPGDDLSATALHEWLQEISANHLVIVNGSASSAGFINFLSGEKRIILSSTKNVSESNAPEYFEFLIKSLQDGSADLNRDERITVYELANQTAQLTQTWYDQNEYIATEHSLLDDNGDGLGTRLLPEDGNEQRKSSQQQTKETPQDGGLAQQVFIKDFQFPENAPDELIAQYLSALDHIQSCKLMKNDLERKEYYRQLESHLIQAASLHQKIISFDSFSGLMQSIQQAIKP